MELTSSTNFGLVLLKRLIFAGLYSDQFQAQGGYDMCAAKPVISQVARGSQWIWMTLTRALLLTAKTINLFPITSPWIGIGCFPS